MNILDVNFNRSDDSFNLITDKGNFFCTASNNSFFPNTFYSKKPEQVITPDSDLSDTLQRELVLTLINDKNPQLSWRFKYVSHVQNATKVCVEYHGDMTRGDSTICEGIFQDEYYAKGFINLLKSLGLDAFIVGKNQKSVFRG